MIERKFTDLTVAQAYAAELSPQLHQLLLFSQEKVGLRFTGQNLDANTLLGQCTTSDQQKAAEIRAFDASDKILLTYAICIESLVVLSTTELRSLVQFWPTNCQYMLTMLETFLRTGEVAMDEVDEIEQLEDGVKLDQNLAAMAEPGFIFLPEGSLSAEEIFYGHWLAIMLKLPVETLMQFYED